MFLKQSHFSGSAFSTSANLSATHFKHNARPQGKLRASSELEHGRADSFCVLYITLRIIAPHPPKSQRLLIFTKTGNRRLNRTPVHTGAPWIYLQRSSFYLSLTGRTQHQNRNTPELPLPVSKDYS